MNEAKELKKLIENGGGTVHYDKYDEIPFDQFSTKWVSEIPKIPKCVFCNADWTPDMIELEEESGYCESCYGKENVIYIACSKCGKIVYRK